MPMDETNISTQDEVGSDLQTSVQRGEIDLISMKNPKQSKRGTLRASSKDTAP
jgi:hypothetical protein